MPEVTPTIYIGLGGSGTQIVRRIKRDLYLNRFPGTTNWKPAFTRFLTIDTVDENDMVDRDAQEFQRSDFVDSETSDKSPEGLAITVNSALITSLQNSRPQFASIWNWLSPTALSGVPGIMGGARQRRMLGRLAFNLNFATVRDRLETLIEEITAELSAPGKAAEKGWTLRQGNDAEATHQKKIHFVVFTSLAGGTGAGCFLDLCYLVRMMQRKYRDKCAGATEQRSLVLYALMDSVFTVGNVDGAQARNTYSCLQDINHYGYDHGENQLIGRIDPYHPFSPPVDQKHVFDWNWGLAANSLVGVNRYEGSDPLAQAIYLISRSNFAGSFLHDAEDAFDLVARHTQIKLRNPAIWKQLWQDGNNINDLQTPVQRTMVLPPDAQGNPGHQLPNLSSTRIRTFGLSRLSTEVGSLRLAASALLAQQELTGWVDMALAEDPPPLDLLADSQVAAQAFEDVEGCKRSSDLDAVAKGLSAKFGALDIETTALIRRPSNVAPPTTIRSIYSIVAGDLQSREGSLIAKHGFASAARTSDLTLAELEAAIASRSAASTQFNASLGHLRVLEGKKEALGRVGGLTALFAAKGRSILDDAIGKKLKETREKLGELVRVELLTRMASAGAASNMRDALVAISREVMELRESANRVAWDGDAVVPGLGRVFESLIPPSVGKGRSRFVLEKFAKSGGIARESFTNLLKRANIRNDVRLRVRTEVLNALSRETAGDAGDILRRLGGAGLDTKLKVIIRNTAHQYCFGVLDGTLVEEQVSNFPDYERGLDNLSEPQLALQAIFLNKAHPVASQIRNRRRFYSETTPNEKILLNEVFGLSLDNLDLSSYLTMWTATDSQTQVAHHSTKNYEAYTPVGSVEEIFRVVDRAKVAVFHLIEGGVTRNRQLIGYQRSSGIARPYFYEDSMGNRSNFSSLGRMIDALGAGREGAQILAYLSREMELILQTWGATKEGSETGRDTHRTIAVNVNVLKKTMQHFNIMDVSETSDKKTSVTCASAADYVYMELLGRHLMGYLKAPVIVAKRRLETITEWAGLNPPLLVKTTAEISEVKERETMSTFGQIAFPERHGSLIQLPMDSFDNRLDPFSQGRDSVSEFESHPDYAPGYYSPIARTG